MKAKRQMMGTSGAPGSLSESRALYAQPFAWFKATSLLRFDTSGKEADNKNYNSVSLYLLYEIWRDVDSHL